MVINVRRYPAPPPRIQYTPSGLKASHGAYISNYTGSPAMSDDFTPPDLPAYGPYTPQQEDARDIAAQLQQSGYPLGPIQPQLSQQTPVGQGLDAAALAVTNSPYLNVRPQNFGQGLLMGAIGGLASSRAGMAQSRALANQQQAQDADALAKERRQAATEFARNLAQHRWAMQAEAAKSTTKPTIHITADPNDPNRVYARGAKIDLPPGEYDMSPEQLKRDAPIDPDENIDYKGLAEGIDNGTLSPTLATGRSSKYTFLLNQALKDRGTNATQKLLDFNATLAFIRSANSTTQLRFRQALEAVPGLVDEVSSLNQQLKDAGIKENAVPLANRVDLAVKRNGFADDPRAQALVTRYRTAVQALPSELGFAEMGGTSPTDKAMDRAVKQFQEASGYDAANAALDEIKRLASIRKNTMFTAGAVGPSNPTGQGSYYYNNVVAPPPSSSGPEADIVKQLQIAARLPLDKAKAAWPAIVAQADSLHIPKARIIALRDSVLSGVASGK